MGTDNELWAGRNSRPASKTAGAFRLIVPGQGPGQPAQTVRPFRMISW